MKNDVEKIHHELYNKWSLARKVSSNENELRTLVKKSLCLLIRP